MSIEKSARRALWATVFWRFVSSAVDVPRDLFRCASRFFVAFAEFFNDVSMACFYMELDAARRYRLLTSVDMGVASGDDERYMGTRPESFDLAVAEYAEIQDDDDD